MSRNWINDYGKARATQKFQAGGPMGAPAPAPGPGPEAAPAPAGGGAPDLEGMLAEYAQTRDPQLAVVIADSLLEMVAAQQGGGEAPQPGMARHGVKTSRAPIFRA